MWKKVLIALFTMIGTFSVIYAYNRNLFATNGNYLVGGEAYGQLGAPTLGDRIYLGTQSNLGTDLGWVILADYSKPNNSTGFVGNNAWFAMATAPVDMTTYYDDVNKIPIFFPQYLSSNTAVYSSLEKFNQRLSNNAKDMEVVVERNIEWFNSMFSHAGVKQLLNDPDYGEAKLMNLNKWYVNWTYGAGADFYSFDNWARAGVTQQFHFWKTSEDYGIVDNGSGGYVGKKVAYPYSGIQEGYGADSYCDAAKSYYCPWTTDPATQPRIVPVPKPQAMGFIVNNKNVASWMGFHLFGGWKDPDSLVENRAVLLVGGDTSDKISFGTFDQPNTGTTDAGGSPINAVRPAINFNKSVLDKVVFSLAKSSSTNGVVKVNPAVKTFNNYNSNEDMKLRIESSATRATFNDIVLDDESIYTTQKISKNDTARIANNKTIELQVDANAGNDNYGVYTISAIITNEAGAFIAYAPLDTAKNGTNNYELDLSAFSMLENGKKYKIQVVNESYSDQNVTPADCSPLTTAYAIELYDPLDQLTASTKSGLIYGTDAVKSNAVVGTVSTIKGYGTPVYTMVADSNHPGESDYFELGTVTDDASGKHTASINVKKNLTDLIPTGDYHFKIQAQDSVKSPKTPLSVDVVVSIGRATQVLKLGSTSKEYIEIDSGAVSKDNYTISTTNTDTNFKPKLIMSGSVAGILNVTLDPSNAKKYVVTPDSSYSGTALPTTYTLEYTADATKNFKAVTTPITREFVLYRKLSALTWTQKENLTADLVNAKGIDVGTLVPVNGVGDFSYEILQPSDSAYDAATGSDYASFQLEKTSGAKDEKVKLKTTGALIAKTYKLQIRVKDQMNNEVVKAITVQVDAAAQEKLYFVDSSGTDITSGGQSVAYGDKTQKLKAEGGNSSKEISYALVPDADQPSSVGNNAADYVTIGSDGSITPKKVGTVKVMATKPADDTYSETTAKMDLTITAGGQKISWTNIPEYQVFEKDQTFSVPAAALIRDNKTTGTIIYGTSTPTICTISGTTVTMKAKGKCTITAKNEDENYQAVNATANIELYTGISGTFTSVKVNQGSDEAKAGSSTSIANITLTGGDGTYTKTSFTVTKDTADMTDSFTLSGSEKSWKITPAKDLKYGTYDVSITYTDGNGGTAVITGAITVGFQSNTSFKLVDGSSTDIPNNVLTKEYEKDLMFYVKTKGELGNGIIHYHMSDDSTTSNPAITIHETSGQVSVSRLTKDNEVYKVYAVVEEDTTNGYAKQTTQEVIIKITEGTQSISFDPSTQEKVQFEENGLFEIKAILTRKDGSSGDISYESTTPTICEITSSNKVKMLDAGTCTIKASNQDENYQKTEKSQSIVLYNQASGSFTQVTTPQAEVDAKLDTALGTFTGEHGKGTLTYENSTDSSVKNQGASLIKVESDGTIRVKQDVSAADLASLATYKDGFYQVNFQVVIKDDGQEAATIDCVANIKGAPLADVRFKDEVNGIITKTYGDTFVLALLNNPGGTPTYQRKADDTLPKDVIDEKIEGSIVKILHANDPDNANLPVIIANIPAANGYDAKEISAKVSINKAKQDGFKFRDENMNMKTESVITPLFEGAKSSKGISLTSGDETILTIVNGDLKTAKKTGTVTVTATANEDRDYESKTITKDIIVYDNLSAAFKQKTPYPQANTDSAKEGALAGQLSVDGGQGTITREVLTGNEFITLPSASSNTVKLNKDITAEDLKGKWNDKVKAYVIKTEIKFTDTLNDTVVGEFTLPVDIYFRGAPLPDVSFADEGGKPTKLIQKPYVLNGDFLLMLTGNTGEGTVKYHLKDDDTLPSDVLVAVDEDGTAYIDNANDKEVNANDVIVQADIEPSNGYEGTTVECVVEIMKAKQDFDIKPKDQDIEMKVNETKTVEFTSTPKGGTVKLELKDPTDSTKLSISGTAITAQETGTVIIKATAPGGRNYEDAIREKNVIIYDDMNVTFTQDHIPQVETDTAVAGIPVGTIELIGGIGEVSAVIDKTKLDGSYFRIDGDSIIIDKAITVDSIKDKWNEEEQAYIMNVQVHLTDSKGNETNVLVPIKIQGAPLTDVAFKGKDGNPTYKIVKPYSKAPFKLELVDNSGGGTVTYSLKQDEGLGVIKNISENGSVTIDNANEKDKDGKAWAIATIGAKNGYDSATIEAEIYIEQAPQPNFKFKESEVTLDYHGTMDTILQNKLSSGEVTYSSGATGIATVDENGTVTAYTTSGDAIITAICKEDRNYLSATATMIVHVVESEAYPLIIEVPSMTYGDSPVQAEIKQQGAKGENLTQTWTSSDESIASIDEQGNITAHHAGTVTITLSQTSDGEPDVSTSVTLTVKPKPIEITIDNKEKLVGEEVPEFTIQPIEGLVGNDGDTFKVPELTCKDQKNNPVNELTPAGSYKIKGTILASENPDYTITKINEGTLVINEDKSSAAWYRLESEATRTQSGWYNKSVDVYIEEISTPYDQIGNSINGPWSDHFTVSKEGINETDIYFRDSKTKAIASKQVAEIKIDMHDPQIISITGSKTNTEPLAKVINAITLDHFYQVGTEIEIVAEDPKPAGVNTISEIERIEYKLYRIIDKQKESEPFKEVTAHSSPARISINEIGIYDVCATAYDHAGNKGKTCQEIEVVEKEEPEEPEKPEECQKTDVKWSITNSDGKIIWYTINEDTNKDGIPDRNIDSDGDGKPDINVDTDDDGKPDVNLLIITKDNWKQTKCVTQHEITYESHVDIKPIINVDLDIKSLEDYHKAIPDINIDTDGDMIPNLNITKENDTKPYLNVLPIKTWGPKQDCKLHGFVYDTMNWTTPLTNYDSDNDGRPDLNIDFDGNGIPDLNIDSDYNGLPDLNIDINGDGIPDYNLDVDENGKPTKNIYPFTEWKPEKDGIYEGVEFDTMEIKGNSELEDNGIVVEKPDGSFLPNYAIKVDDVTSSKKEEVEKEALNEIKETQEIKAVYDVKLFENDVEIQPDGTLKVRIPIPEGITNPKLMIKKGDGSYEIISAKEENGYLIYETNELGIVSIIGDKEEITKDPKPTPDPDSNSDLDSKPTTSDQKQENPKPTVQGDYTDTGIGKNMGGVLSGDSSNICIYSIGCLVSLASLISILYKRKSKDQACIK